MRPLSEPGSIPGWSTAGAQEVLRCVLKDVYLNFACQAVKLRVSGCRVLRVPRIGPDESDYCIECYLTDGYR